MRIPTIEVQLASAPADAPTILINEEDFDPSLHRKPVPAAQEPTVEVEDPEDEDEEPELDPEDARIAEAAALTVDQLREWVKDQDELELVRAVIDAEETKDAPRSMALATLRAKERELEESEE